MPVVPPVAVEPPEPTTPPAPLPPSPVPGCDAVGEHPPVEESHSSASAPGMSERVKNRDENVIARSVGTKRSLSL
jgi:hypothetical protein